MAYKREYESHSIEQARSVAAIMVDTLDDFTPERRKEIFSYLAKVFNFQTGEQHG